MCVGKAAAPGARHARTGQVKWSVPAVTYQDCEQRAHCDNLFFIPTEDVTQNKMTNLEKIFVLIFHIKASTFKMKDKFNRLEHGTSSVDLQAWVMYVPFVKPSD